MLPSKILVPVDGSEGAETILGTLSSLLGSETERILLRAIAAKPRVLRFDPTVDLHQVETPKLRAAFDALNKLSRPQDEVMVVEGAAPQAVLHAVDEAGCPVVALTPPTGGCWAA